MSDLKVKDWVKQALKVEGFDNFEVEICGQIGKGENYLSKVLFVKVTQPNKLLNLVVKYAEEDENLRQQLPLEEVFDREIHIYKNVKTTFEQFQKDKGVENLTNYLPQCYGVLKNPNNEVLIFEDLKAQGFKPWNRKLEMKRNHLISVLEAYAKWHSLSFALRDQKPEVFHKLTNSNKNLYFEFCERAGTLTVFLSEIEYLRKAFEPDNETELLTFMDFDLNDVTYITKILPEIEPEHQVISHGDCWNTNFLFKYQDTGRPEEVRILDWQCSSLNSPVTDLSHFLFSCASYEDLKDIVALLRIYHNSLSDSLRKLGSDVEKLFSFDTLLRHWKKFAIYGIYIAPLIIKFAISESGDAPDFAESAGKGLDPASNFTFRLKDETELKRRVRNVFLSYIEHLKQIDTQKA